MDKPVLLNRELSWIQFNHRVLCESGDPRNPLLERCRFLGITASNLDEFTMVRVAGLKQQVAAGYASPDAAGMTPKQQLKAVAMATHEFVDQQYQMASVLTEQLSEAGVHLLQGRDLTVEQQQAVEGIYTSDLFPILTPVKVDASRPLPYLASRRLYLMVRLRQGKGKNAPEDAQMALLPIPNVLPRWYQVPSERGMAFLRLEEILHMKLPRLFDLQDVEGALLFRITRDSDLTINEDADDLLNEIAKSVRKRRWGNVVRLEYSRQSGGMDADPWICKFLIDKLSLRKRDIFEADGPVDLTCFSQLPGLVDKKRLLYPKQPPAPQEGLLGGPDIFSVIRQRDWLLSLPYEPFDPIQRLLDEAAEDEDVLAIKQTLYRVSKHSPVVQALTRAAEAGKQVTVLVELKARFDEENNIGWARVLEQAGCHVIYGVPGLKVHCKVLMVVRREADGLRRYLHLGTGNYNESTARLYTDFGLLTCREELGEDCGKLFNMLTAMAAAPDFQKLYVSPHTLRPFLLREIDAQADLARAGRPARIRAKVNSLLDPEIIQHLYAASQAGTPIDLVVRGICALVPGNPDFSPTIRVRSIVGRYLEHHRIFAFGDGGNARVYLASADWMPRNLDRRVETCFPVEDEDLAHRVLSLLDTAIADNQKAWAMQPDGRYFRVRPEEGEPPVGFQEACYAQALRNLPDNPIGKE